MRVLFSGLFIVIFFSSGCLIKSPRRKPIYPDKDLKEILITGRYVPEDKGKIKELKKELEEALISEYQSERKISGIISELSSPDTGKERFIYSSTMYCYNEKSSKESVLDKSLKARLYDKEENLLSEDFLRWDGPFYPESQSVISYIPYHNEGHEIFIVNLKEEKEVILKKLSVQSQEKLREKSIAYDPVYKFYEWWRFHEENECHISPAHF